MDRLLQDLRFAFRSFRRQPGFAAIVVVTLALGIGVNLSVFQTAYGMLLRPLPFVDAEGLVALGMRHETLEVEAFDFSQQDVRDFRDQCTVCESVAAFDERDVVLGSAAAESAWRVQGQAVSPELFGLLGVRAAVGRTLTLGDRDAQAIREVVIGHGLWQQLGGNHSILGQDLKIDGRPAQVVGVMPPEFRFPERSDLWLPLERRSDARRADRWIDNVLVRLRPEVSLEQAQQEADVLAAAMAVAHPESNRFWSFSLMPFRERLVGGDGRMVLALLGLSVAFIWLIACVNITNLLFARESSRVRSVAIRIALGSDRASLIRQRMTENLLLALAGGGLGVLLAMWSLDLLAHTSPEGWPSWLRFDLTTQGVLFSLTLTVLSAFVFGLLPSLRASRPRQGPLVDGERGTSDGEAQGLQGHLVVVQIALALVLLVSAGLVGKSVQALWQIDAGFDTANILTLRTLPTGERYEESEARVALYEQVISRLETLPGVKAVAATSTVPLVEDGTAIPYFHPQLNLNGDERQVASYILQTPGLFDVLQLPVLAGRRFTADEARSGDSRVIMINDALAERVWPAGNAVGQSLRLGYEADAPEYTVVGVVPKIYYEEPGEETEQSRFQIHLPYAWTPWRSMAIMLRTHTEPSTLVADVRRELAQIDAAMAVDSVRSLDSIRGEVIWSERLQSDAFGMFAVMALLLSVVGIYGVMSYLVSRRTREIGVRMALGADRQVIGRLFLSRGSWMIGKGVVLGLLGSLAVARLLSHAFFGIGGVQLGPIAVASLVLIAAAGVGIALPAGRATRVEPTVALESE